MDDKLMLPATVPVTFLQLRDVVRLDLEAWADAIVHRIDADGTVHVRRPYMHAADFSYTGGVITTIGLEDFPMRPVGDITLVRRPGDSRDFPRPPR